MAGLPRVASHGSGLLPQLLGSKVLGKSCWISQVPCSHFIVKSLVTALTVRLLDRFFFSCPGEAMAEGLQRIIITLL